MFRKINKNDGDIILNIFKECFESKEIPNINYIDIRCNNKEGYLFNYENQNIGLLLFSKLSNGDILLSFLAVKEKYRNKGIGNLLIDLLKKSFNKSIYLHVRTKNIFAIKLYEKNGFKIIRKEDNYYNYTDNNDDAFYMEYKC